jgi:uncharacterized protein
VGLILMAKTNWMEREFQIFVKPVGSACNLRCSYCYYLDKHKLYGGSSPHFMTDEILETYIVQHIEAATDKVIVFSWHGGEPTLAGLDFFRKVVSVQKKYLPEGYKIINGIQTNGTLLDDGWCRFFSEENFIIGISMDGPEELHDIFRRKADGGSSFSLVMRGWELLKKYNITSEVLCVLNSFNIRQPLVVYNFFKSLGARFITFLPLVEPSPGSDEGVSPYSVDPLEYGEFLIKVFNEWMSRDIEVIRIQTFEEAVRTAFSQEHTLCIFKVTCGGVPVVEHNGDFYSCDHYVDKEHLVGNIRDKSLTELLDSPEQKAFGEAKYSTLPGYCLNCEVLEMCNGECPKNRFITTPEGEPGLNYLCKGYKLFFNHCKPFVETLRIISRR